ncbi:hypothetical protein, partial [Burkholderia singularis]|uniref:hypothetical protein n=1 Tax=Burkholderia singularis TaxID=1503053 RepID=UPI001C3FFB07
THARLGTLPCEGKDVVVDIDCGAHVALLMSIKHQASPLYRRRIKHQTSRIKSIVNLASGRYTGREPETTGTGFGDPSS